MIQGGNKMKRLLIEEMGSHVGETVILKGWVHRKRSLKNIQFLILRDRSGMVQTVIGKEVDLQEVGSESVVELRGKVTESGSHLSPYELQVESLTVLNPSEEPAIEVNKEDLSVNLDTLLDNRVLSLRHEKTLAIFRIQNLILEGFRSFLQQEGFTEIRTPKIVSEGAEGGTEIFKVKYFEKEAYLTQSPQFYKQMMVSTGFERVFETGAVYRAEEHNTNRHLNEYISLDLEMAFIEDEHDLMDLEERLLVHTMELIRERGTSDLALLGASLPEITLPIPRMPLREAVRILKEVCGHQSDATDLDPEGERQIASYAKETLGSEFLFVTDYPRRKRPMYAMPLGEEGTRSFDLLFRGLEITTGGQRIHQHDMLVESFRKKGLEPANYEGYLKCFRQGMPPHGGLAIGLERMTAMLLGLTNVRQASLFPRDRQRLTP
jgi:nondiscriminating aspartyl-tRNA synthetase